MTTDESPTTIQAILDSEPDDLEEALGPRIAPLLEPAVVAFRNRPLTALCGAFGGHVFVLPLVERAEQAVIPDVTHSRWLVVLPQLPEGGEPGQAGLIRAGWVVEHTGPDDTCSHQAPVVGSLDQELHRHVITPPVVAAFRIDGPRLVEVISGLRGWGPQGMSWPDYVELCVANRGRHFADADLGRDSSPLAFDEAIFGRDSSPLIDEPQGHAWHELLSAGHLQGGIHPLNTDAAMLAIRLSHGDPSERPSLGTLGRIVDAAARRVVEETARFAGVTVYELGGDTLAISGAHTFGDEPGFQRIRWSR